MSRSDKKESYLLTRRKKRKTKIDPTKAVQQEAIPLYRLPVDELISKQISLSVSYPASLLFLSCRVVSCLVLSLVRSCRVVSCRVLSCLVASCLGLSCLVLSCLVFSCLVLFCFVLSCIALSCLVLSCRVISCFVLSCLTLTLTMHYLISVFAYPSLLLTLPPFVLCLLRLQILQYFSRVVRDDGLRHRTYFNCLQLVP